MQTKPVLPFKKHELHAKRVEDIQREIDSIINRYKDRVCIMSSRFDSTQLMILAGLMGRLSEATYTVYNYIDFNATYSGYSDKTRGKVTRKHLKALNAMIARITEWQKELHGVVDVYREESESEGTSFYYDTHRLLRRFKMTIFKEVVHIVSNTRIRYERW